VPDGIFAAETGWNDRIKNSAMIAKGIVIRGSAISTDDV
jgi:hypothetical protein